MKRGIFFEKLFVIFLLPLFFLAHCIGFKQVEHASAIITQETLRDVINIVPILILGSGPAGLSAAVYAARSNKYTVVLHGNKPGGLLTETTWVENWPGSERILGADIIKQLQKQAKRFGAHFVHDTVESVDLSQWPFVIKTEEGFTLNALTLIIATGATPRYLGILGEDEYWGMGVTTCAVCDAPFYKDKSVVVIGGGDSAVEEAIQLASYAKKVTILVRKDRMRAAASMQKLLKGFDNIIVEHNKVVEEINGDGDKVTTIVVYDTAQGTREKRQVDGVFLAIGHEPNSILFKDALETDARGYVAVKGRGQETSISGVFAAGDVEDHTYRQAGVAAGSGIKAALQADRFSNDRGFTDYLVSRLEGQFFDVFAKREGEGSLLVRNRKELEEILKETSVPVIVDFYADYCPSCVQMLPLFESVAHEYTDRAVFLRVDAQKAIDILKHYDVLKVPTLIIFKGNQLLERYSFVMDRSELRAVVESVLQ